jgi:hypothetical protein
MMMSVETPQEPRTALLYFGSVFTERTAQVDPGFDVV